MNTKTKGRIAAILLSLAMVFTMMPMMAAPAYAWSRVTIDGLEYMLNDNGTAGVIGFTDEMPANVTVPAEIVSGDVTYPVVDILGFQNCAKLESITIPKRVTKIKDTAFKNSGLTSVTFESGSALTEIGFSAFQDCANLKSITIPNSVTSILYGAFKNSGLTSVTFESGSALTEIGVNVFQDCANLKSITIPNSVTSILNGAFENSGLTSVTFESGSALTEIGFAAFINTGLTSVVIPSGVTTIAWGAFKECSSLSTVYYEGTKDQWDNMPDRDDGWAGGRENDINIIFVIEVPEGKTLTYNGDEQTGVEAGTGYTLSGTTSATNVETYEATATLEDGYEWSDGTTEDKTIKWKIDKAVVEVAVPTGKNFTYNGKAKTGVAAGTDYILSGTTKATNAGSYTAKATLKKDDNYTYKWADGTTAVKSITWKINKANNPLAMKPKTATVKYKSLKKKAQPLAVTKVISFTKQLKDKKNYTLSSAKKGKKSFKKYFSINKTTGKVAVKKGLKKGTYKVQVKVKALGNANYKDSALKTVTFKVVVK